MITLFLCVLVPAATFALGAWVGYKRGQIEGWRKCRQDEEDAS